MPTPSSNPPPDPSSPRSYSFSTCPDDLQHAPWQSHDAVQEHDDMGVQPVPSTLIAPPVFDAPPTPEGPAIDDAQASEDASSRSTTMSPGPQSTATAVTSPIPSGPDGDLVKSRDAEIGSQLSRQESNCTQPALEAEMTPRAAPRRRASPIDDWESSDPDTQDDELWSPAMGSDYSCMRVST